MVHHNAVAAAVLVPADEGHGAAGGSQDGGAALGHVVLAAVEVTGTAGDGADPVAERGSRGQLASGAPRLPAEAARVIDPADWALSSCFSLPSGSAWVTTAERLKSILAAARRKPRGCGAAHRGDGLPGCRSAMTGLVAGTVTVRTRPVAASAMPAFWPMPLAAAKSVIWRKAPRGAARFALRIAGPLRGEASAAPRRRSGAAARRRPLGYLLVKKGSSLDSLRS